MACTTCSYTKTVPTCITNLIVGTIDDLSSDVYVFIKNISTGKIDRFEATSDGAGLVTLSSIPTNYFMDEHDYEIWVTLRTVSQNDRESITIDGVSDTCWAMPLLDLYDGSGEKQAITTHTLEDQT